MDFFCKLCYNNSEGIIKMQKKDHCVFMNTSYRLKDRSKVCAMSGFIPKGMEETQRPLLYRGMKYWGKKPHNIWRELIIRNTSEKDIVYDPFAGSALTFFESIKAKRKPVVADINPLTLFMVELYSKRYDLDKIAVIAKRIIDKAKHLKLYKQEYLTKCSACGKLTDIFNYRVYENSLEKTYKCQCCGKTITEEVIKKQKSTQHVCSLNLWKPDCDLSNFASVSQGFINAVGGANISNVWTTKNLELLSFIFNEINNCRSVEKDALMFGFLQTVHLTTKMCALRGKESNRPLSTSWGRPAYLGLKTFMEQNPILQFERSIYGKTGVIKCLESRNNYLPGYTYSTNLNDINTVDGVVLLQDSKEITSGFKPSLVLTDPPYGDIIQYGELSQIWNVWLEKYSSQYRISLEKEIIVNKHNCYDEYIKNMTVVLSNCRRLLYPDGTMIITFNSNKTVDWDSLNSAIKQSKMCLTESVKQKNKRSSEANVCDKTGIGITDFYLLLTKK